MSINTTLVSVFPEDVDVLKIPQRPYDFDSGDRRFTELENAIEYAQYVATGTGVRQIVRKDSAPHFTTLWLVQAIGS